MKIRTDFVTNSSSVSYIITMSKTITDLYKRNFIHHSEAIDQRIFALLSEDMLSSGTRVMFEGKELYTKIIKFDNGGDCMFDDSFGVAVAEVDFSKQSDEELWAYIYGEYIVGGKISKFWGFGATQVETY